MSDAQQIRIPLYPCVTYKQSLMDRLRGRHKLGFDPVGALETTSPTSFRFTLHDRSRSVELGQGVTPDLAVRTLNDIDVLTVQFRPTDDGPADSHEITFRVGFPEGAFRSLGLPERTSLHPAMTTPDFARFWSWLTLAAAQLGQTIPAINVPADHTPPLRTPGHYARCIGCRSWLVIVRDDRMRCLACGYAEESPEEKQRADTFKIDVDSMTTEERWHAVLGLLDDTRLGLTAHIPDLELAGRGDGNDGLRQQHAFDAFDAVQHAFQDARKATFLAPDPSLVKPVLDSLEFVSTMNPTGRGYAVMSKVERALTTIEQATRAVQKESASGR